MCANKGRGPKKMKKIMTQGTLHTLYQSYWGGGHTGLRCDTEGVGVFVIV